MTSSQFTMQQIHVVYLNSQKAFYIDPHNTFLYKIKQLDIVGTIHDELAEWLSNKQQRSYFRGDMCY